MLTSAGLTRAPEPSTHCPQWSDEETEARRQIIFPGPLPMETATLGLQGLPEGLEPSMTISASHSALFSPSFLSETRI